MERSARDVFVVLHIEGLNRRWKMMHDNRTVVTLGQDGFIISTEVRTPFDIEPIPCLIASS